MAFDVRNGGISGAPLSTPVLRELLCAFMGPVQARVVSIVEVVRAAAAGHPDAFQRHEVA